MWLQVRARNLHSWFWLRLSSFGLAIMIVCLLLLGQPVGAFASCYGFLLQRSIAAVATGVVWILLLFMPPSSLLFLGGRSRCLCLV